MKRHQCVKECLPQKSWHVHRLNRVQKLFFVTILTNGVLSLEVRLVAESRIQLQGLNMKTETEEMK